MLTRVINNKYAPIRMKVPVATLLDDVDIVLDSEYLKADLLVYGSPYVATRNGEELALTPDTVWLEGIAVSITVAGETTKFVVPNNRFVYSPEQRLYSLDNLQPTGNLDELLKLGLVTPREKSLLDSMGPKLRRLMLQMSECLVTRFVYDGTTPPEDCTTLKGFRRMQQVMYMFGLDTIVESILFSPGPERDWFREARVLSPNTDEDVFRLYAPLEKELHSLENTMNRLNLNTSKIATVDLQIPTKSGWNPVLRGLATLSCALRYTHDDTKFSY